MNRPMVAIAMAALAALPVRADAPRCRTLVPRAMREVARPGIAAGIAAARDEISSLTAGWPRDPVANEVDVLVAYDASALAWLSQERRTMQEHAAAQVAKANAALANSGLAGDFKFALSGVCAASLDVTDGGAADTYGMFAAILTGLDAADKPDWALAIDAERDRLGADLVMVCANTQPEVADIADIVGTLGLSYGMKQAGGYGLTRTVAATYRAAAYGACDVRVVERDHTFVHELGHMLGAGHADNLSPAIADPGPQLFADSSALMYRDDADGAHYYTIMGFNSLDGNAASPLYVELPFFSSPNLANPATGTALGDEAHDNASTLRRTIPLVAQYRVRKVPAAAIGAEWQKARTLHGAATRALPSPYAVAGTFELKCGKANKKGVAKVSATLTDLDGKKTRYKAQSVPVAGERAVVSWGDGIGAFKVTIEGDRFYGGHVGLSGAVGVASASVGGALADDAHCVRLADFSFSPDGEVQEQLLPLEGREEPLSLNGLRWGFARAASVKYAKDRASGLYSLVVDESRNRTNLSGMRLSYAAKTGLFKGGFTVYSLVTAANGRTKLKKHSAKVSGVVVDGKGYGRAKVSRADVGVVTVE